MRRMLWPVRISIKFWQELEGRVFDLLWETEQTWVGGDKGGIHGCTEIRRRQSMPLAEGRRGPGAKLDCVERTLSTLEIKTSRQCLQMAGSSFYEAKSSHRARRRRNSYELIVIDMVWVYFRCPLCYYRTTLCKCLGLFTVWELTRYRISRNRQIFMDLQCAESDERIKAQLCSMFVTETHGASVRSVRLLSCFSRKSNRDNTRVGHQYVHLCLFLLWI